MAAAYRRPRSMLVTVSWQGAHSVVTASRRSLAQSPPGG